MTLVYVALDREQIEEDFLSYDDQRVSRAVCAVLDALGSAPRQQAAEIFRMPDGSASRVQWRTPALSPAGRCVVICADPPEDMP